MAHGRLQSIGFETACVHLHLDYDTSHPAASSLALASSTSRIVNHRLLRQTLPHQSLPAGASPDRPTCSCSWACSTFININSVSRDRPVGPSWPCTQLIHVLHLELSCFLDHLRIQWQSCAPVSELLGTGCAVRDRQHLQLPESVQLPLLRSSTDQSLRLAALRMLCRKARNITATNRGGYFSQVFALPFNN